MLRRAPCRPGGGLDWPAALALAGAEGLDAGEAADLLAAGDEGLRRGLAAVANAVRAAKGDSSNADDE